MEFFRLLPEKAYFKVLHKIESTKERTKLKLLRDYDIILPQIGNILLKGSMGEVRLHPGEAFLAVPGESIQTCFCSSDSSVRVWIVHFSCDEVTRTGLHESMSSYSRDEADAGKWLYLPKKASLDYPAAAYRILKAMLEENRFYRSRYKEMLTLYTRTLLYELHRSGKSAEQASEPAFPAALANRYVRRIINYLHRNCNREIEIKDIVELLGLNYNYANTLFKAYTGRTIMKYVDNIRMNHARELLLSTSLNLDEIAQLVGMNDGHYFSKKFKKWEGISPNQFRKQDRGVE